MFTSRPKDYPRRRVLLAMHWWEDRILEGVARYAAECEFANRFHLSRAFARTTGVSPNSYRKHKRTSRVVKRQMTANSSVDSGRRFEFPIKAYHSDGNSRIAMERNSTVPVSPWMPMY